MEKRTVLPGLPEELKKEQKLYEIYRSNQSAHQTLKKEKHYQRSPENYNQYKKTINKKFVEDQSTDAFIKFILDFTKNGGGIQNLGELDNPTIKNWLLDEINVERLKIFLLRPFETDFNLDSWLDGIKEFKGMGIGIFTIYLNRINRKKYPVLNGSTVSALSGLSLSINTPRQRRLAYKKLIDFTDKLLEWYPDELFEDKTVWDSCFYFISSELAGKPWQKFLADVIDFYNHLPQEIHISDKNRNAGNNRDYICIGRYYRDSQAIKRLKKKENCCCQICGTKILLPENELYCEGHHIKPLGQQGEDRNDNIIIVCPNCHVKLDKFAMKIELEKIKSDHVINTEFIDFHNEQVVKKII